MCATPIIFIWGFPEMGVPLKIIPFNGIFPNKNHPNFGIPAFVETPITYSKIFRQPPIPQVPLSQEPLARAFRRSDLCNGLFGGLQ